MCRKSSEIEQFVRGSRLLGLSSVDLGWNGFAIGRHSLPEGERPQKSSDHHFIALWDTRSCHDERADLNGRFISFFRANTCKHGGQPRKPRRGVLIEGAVAHFIVRVGDVHSAGDHTLYFGTVQYFEHRDDKPLLFYAGKYEQLLVER